MIKIIIKKKHICDLKERNYFLRLYLCRNFKLQFILLKIFVLKLSVYDK